MLPTRPVTLKVIAEYVGCSKTVVSHVLNDSTGSSRVSEGLRQRIFAAAHSLGYQPNYLGASLSRGSTHMLGVVIGEMSTLEMHIGLWGQVLGGLDAGAREAGYHLLIVGSDGKDIDGLTRGQAMLQQGQIDCLLVPSHVYQNSPTHLTQIEASNAPHILFLLNNYASRHPGVVIDDNPGLTAAAEHLASLGHRQVLWAGAMRDGVELLPYRRQQFFDAATQLGLEISRCQVEIEERAESATISRGSTAFHAQISAWLQEHPVPSAIMAYNEIAGIGIYQALRDLGLRVPDDVSVIGYDNIYAEAAYPPMTVVSLCLPEVGRQWARLAIAVANGEDAGDHNAVRSISTSLVVRESTAHRLS